MKHKIKNSCIAVFSTALLSANMLNAQDTVIVRKTTIDSVTVRKTDVVHDTVAKQRVVHDTVAVVKENDEKTLYRGEFCVRYLPTFTSLAINNYNGTVIQGNATMSNGFGVMLGHNFSKNVGIQIEINYDQVSQKYKDQGLDKQVSINYINVPLLLSINTDKTCPVVFGVVVGPQFGINIGSSFNGGTSANTKDTLHAVLAVKQGDVGLAYGAGFGIALNQQRNIRLDLGFRGVYGLVDMSATPTGDNSYNILVKGSRKAYGGYAGITFLF